MPHLQALQPWGGQLAPAVRNVETRRVKPLKFWQKWLFKSLADNADLANFTKPLWRVSYAGH